EHQQVIAIGVEGVKLAPAAHHFLARPRTYLLDEDAVAQFLGGLDLRLGFCKADPEISRAHIHRAFRAIRRSHFGNLLRHWRTSTGKALIRSLPLLMRICHARSCWKTCVFPPPPASRRRAPGDDRPAHSRARALFPPASAQFPRSRTR